MSVIKIENLTVQYLGEETNALDGVSLEIQKGEFVALLGAYITTGQIIPGWF